MKPGSIQTARVHAPLVVVSSAAWLGYITWAVCRIAIAQGL